MPFSEETQSEYDVAAYDALSAAPQGLHARVKRALFPLAQRFTPRLLARFLAKRYLCSSHGFLEELKGGRHLFELLPIGSDTSVLRTGPAKALEPAGRVLIIHGHDGHYRQFLRLIRTLKQRQAEVDMVVLPGHMRALESKCSMHEMTEAILRAEAAHGPYDTVIAHCVSSNALVFGLERGLATQRLVLVSTPINLTALVKFGGEQYGLSGRALEAFVAQVDALNAQAPLDTDWRALVAESPREALIVHARNDYVAPLSDAAELARLWPGAEIYVSETGGHNTLLNVTSALNAIADFAMQSRPPPTS